MNFRIFVLVSSLLLGLTASATASLSEEQALQKSSASTFQHKVTKIKLSSSSAHQDDPKVVEEFQTMLDNIKTMDYKMIFNTYNDVGVDGYSFTNFYNKNSKQRWSELKSLEGEKFFLILKDGLVKYSNYTVKSEAITDILPNLFNANLEEIQKNYLITKAGLDRVADRDGDVFDLTNKYSNLFSYQVVIDRETKLPLKVILVERDLVNYTYLVLNTFIVSYLSPYKDQATYHQIEKLDVSKDNQLTFVNQIQPEVLNGFNKLVNFQYTPAGFELSSTSVVTLYGNSVINSLSTQTSQEAAQEDLGPEQEYYAMTYSDGLFNFTVYVSANEIDSDDHYYWKNSDTSLYVEDYAKHKVIVVGQIPMTIAKGVLNSIEILGADGKPIQQSHPEGYGQRIEL